MPALEYDSTSALSASSTESTERNHLLPRRMVVDPDDALSYIDRNDRTRNIRAVLGPLMLDRSGTTSNGIFSCGEAADSGDMDCVSGVTAVGSVGMPCLVVAV